MATDSLHVCCNYNSISGSLYAGDMTELLVAKTKHSQPSNGLQECSKYWPAVTIETLIDR